MITLKTLPAATAQEVYDQIKTHLLTQKVKAYDSWRVLCFYHLGDLKCAAGCLIADEEYRKDMEHNSWTALVKSGLAPDTHKSLIRVLQSVHDEYDFEKWHEKLRRVAKTYGLNP